VSVEEGEPVRNAMSCRHRGAVAALMVAGAVLALGACGSDSSSSSSASSASSASSSPTPSQSSVSTSGAGASTAPSAAPATKSPVLIGALVDLTGSAKGDRDRLAKVLPAWAKFVNAHGGLGGHPVQLDIHDTTSDAATAQSEATALIAKQPVAIYLDSSATESAIAESLGKSGIPIVGVGYSPAVWGAKLTSLGVNCDPSGKPVPCALPNAFTLATTFGAVIDMSAVAAKEAGATKVAMVACAEIDSCSSAEPEFQATVKALGMQYEGLIKVSSSAPDYTAQCIQLIQDKVDYVFTAIQEEGTVKLWNSCAEQGFEGKFVSSTSAICCNLLKIDKLRLVGSLNAFPWFVDDAPVKQFRDAMTAGGLSADDYSSSTATGAWSALQLVAKASATLPDSPTKADVLNGLYSLKDETLDGLLPPVTFTRGQPAPPRNCFWLLSYQDQKLANPLGGLQYSCYPKQ
jgi:branched-chain amino acid transport system substrate-binding protein